MSKNSKQRYRDDYSEVEKYIYRTHGSGPNLYEENSRKYRMYEKINKRYWTMEARMDDLAQVYGGFRPDRKKPKSI